MSGAPHRSATSLQAGHHYVPQQQQQQMRNRGRVVAQAQTRGPVYGRVLQTPRTVNRGTTPANQIVSKTTTPSKPAPKKMTRGQAYGLFRDLVNPFSTKPIPEDTETSTLDGAAPSDSVINGVPTQGIPSMQAVEAGYMGDGITGVQEGVIMEGVTPSGDVVFVENVPGMPGVVEEVVPYNGPIMNMTNPFAGEVIVQEPQEGQSILNMINPFAEPQMEVIQEPIVAVDQAGRPIYGVAEVGVDYLPPGYSDPLAPGSPFPSFSPGEKADIAETAAVIEKEANYVVKKIETVVGTTWTMVDLFISHSTRMNSTIYLFAPIILMVLINGMAFTILDHMRYMVN